MQYGMSSMVTSADPRLLGALRKTVSGGGVWLRMDETHLSVFHSVSNRARVSRNSISSAARISSRFLFFLSKSKRLDDIHVT